ncbi:MAG: helix-turn-helix domain-containing protein [Armatimonadetes bacterium]|nr:helix-turn-helix domain-containing protein [Armatimonadota bacterium]
MSKILLTVNEVCHATGLGRSKVYEFVRSGQLPILKIGRSTRIRAEDLATFLDRCKKGHVAPDAYKGDRAQ